MALPKLLQKLFQNGGAGSKLNESIMPYAYARSVNGKHPDSVGNIEIPARNVGDEWHSFTGQIPVGGVPYCGQEVTRATYADLWAYVQSKGLVKTESEWQALNTSRNGNVPFYSDGDGSTTFRMPKLVGYIKGAASQSESGGYTAEGLPNITGQTNSIAYVNYQASSGALQIGQSFAGPIGSGGLATCSEILFNASRSNSIYGNSYHVTPETTIILFGVYAFGEITNIGALDADTLATGLATLEANTNAHIRVVETWKGGNNWYRKYSDGWIEQGGFSETIPGIGGLTVNLFTAMSSIEYMVLAGTAYGSLAYDAGGIVVTGRSNTSFSIDWFNANLASGTFWYACGY